MSSVPPKAASHPWFSKPRPSSQKRDLRPAQGQSVLWGQLMQVVMAVGPLTKSNLGSHRRRLLALWEDSALGPCGGHTDPPPRCLHLDLTPHLGPCPP